MHNSVYNVRYVGYDYTAINYVHLLRVLKRGVTVRSNYM